MPDRDDILEKETFKGAASGEDYEVSYRTYLALSSRKTPKGAVISEQAACELVDHKLAKVLSLLLEHLERKQLLTRDEIDTFLLDATR